MSIAKTYTAQLSGLSADIITIEVDISHGLHSFSIVGLGDQAVNEARDRVAAAIKNSGHISPKQKNQKVVISLAPADLRKEGPSFDLAIALAYLKAAGDIDFDPERTLFFGELSLGGRIRKISGLLPILCQVGAKGFNTIFIPEENLSEASLARGLDVRPAASLREVLDHLSGISAVPKLAYHEPHALAPQYTDIQLVRGNESAKRGLEIAAAGAHNVMLYGPPGTGKTMLANCFASILPPLSYEESVEVTGIHSAARVLGQGLITHPPFRSPHHTASYPSVVGGGSFPRPGEITLAHRGVLFMDEFPEFDRTVIEALRQPLEEHSITISRARGSVTFPAQTILVASMNPCPCGKGRDQGCTCPAHILEAYERKISGPITDRFDIWLNVSKVDYRELAKEEGSGEHSETVRSRVVDARSRARDRMERYGIHKLFNAEMDAPDIEICAMLDKEARELLAVSAERFRLSGRAFHRVIKVARTIADLSGEEFIKPNHILEALQYRKKLGQSVPSP